MTNIPVWWRQQRKRTDDYGLIKDIPGSIITLLEKHFSLLIISVPWDEPRVVPASESLPTSLSFHRLSEVWFSAHWRLFLSAGDTIDKWDLCRLRIETSLSRQSQNQSSSWRTRRATQLNGWTEITSLCSAHFFMLTLSAASSLDWERCEHNALGILRPSCSWSRTEPPVSCFLPAQLTEQKPSVAGLRAEVKSWRVFIEDRLGQRWRSVQAEHKLIGHKMRKQSRGQNLMFLQTRTCSDF